MNLVVRRLGSARTHVLVQAGPELITPGHFIRLYPGVQPPVVVACQVILKDRAALVVMEPGTTVRCLACARLSGVTEQEASEYEWAKAICVEMLEGT